jgi:hypothetical protein
MCHEPVKFYSDDNIQNEQLPAPKFAIIYRCDYFSLSTNFILSFNSQVAWTTKKILRSAIFFLVASNAEEIAYRC